MPPFLAGRYVAHRTVSISCARFPTGILERTVQGVMKRDWHTYFAKHHFKERRDEPWPDINLADARAHLSKKLEGWEAQVLRLPAPIVALSADVHRVHDTIIFGTRVRIYPPFQLDRRGETAGAFKECWIPEGEQTVTRLVRLASDAVTGLVAENVPVEGARYCQALRIDTNGPAEIHKIVQILLEQVCQHTHQWWLRGRANPFAGIRRLGCDVNQDFSLVEIFRHHGAGDLASPWHGTIETQSLLGIEHALTEQTWKKCIDQAAAGMRGDMGLLAFHDAISYYMDADEVLCIISMTLTVEILGNKRRLLLGKKPTGFSELIRTSDLIDSAAQPIIQKLFIDRGHVAHGRRPPRSEGRADRLFEYLEAVRTVVSAYTSKLSTADWPTASQLEVSRGAA